MPPLSPDVPPLYAAEPRMPSIITNTHLNTNTVAMLLSSTQVFGFLFMLENILLNMGDLAVN